MATRPSSAEADTKACILEILDENQVMAVATLRPDGWPQTTMVGFVRDDLTLYFGVAQASQKLANIRHDPRISIAMGHHGAGRLRGLSMAAHAVEVIDSAEIDHLNHLMRDRYPRQSRLSPRAASTAVLRAEPMLISLIDLDEGPGQPRLARVGAKGAVHRIPNTGFHSPARADPTGRGPAQAGMVHVNVAGSAQDVYRPGAPL